jgi:hypothetical protein
MVFVVWHPIPSRVLVMTTGGEGGDYFDYGKRCRDFLKKSGIEQVKLSPQGHSGSTRQLMVASGMAKAAREAGAEIHFFEEAGWPAFDPPLPGSPGRNRSFPA